MSLDKFYIPRSLDDPDVLCYCTMVELAILALCIMLGLFMKAFGVGLLIGGALIFCAKKIKAQFGAEQIVLMLYWYLPMWVSGFTYLPHSHKRYYIG